MELILTLRKIINDKYVAPVASPGFFQLEEKQVPNYPVTKVRYHKYRDFLPCIFDAANSNLLYPIFAVKQPGLSAICDYVLFFEKRRADKPVLYVFLCNLKSTNTNQSSRQVEASQILVEYVVKTAIRLLDYQPFQIRYRALIFSLKHIARFYTKPRKDAYSRLGKSGIMQMHLRAGNNCYLDFLAK